MNRETRSRAAQQQLPLTRVSGAAASPVQTSPRPLPLVPLQPSQRLFRVPVSGDFVGQQRSWYRGETNVQVPRIAAKNLRPHPHRPHVVLDGACSRVPDLGSSRLTCAIHSANKSKVSPSRGPLMAEGVTAVSSPPLTSHSVATSSPIFQAPAARGVTAGEPRGGKSLRVSEAKKILGLSSKATCVDAIGKDVSQDRGHRRSHRAATAARSSRNHYHGYEHASGSSLPAQMSSPDDPTPRGDSREVAGSVRRLDDPPMWESMGPPRGKGGVSKSVSYQFQTTHNLAFNATTATVRTAPPGAHAHFRYRSNWEMGGDVPVDRERFRTTASDFQLGVQSVPTTPATLSSRITKSHVPLNERPMANISRYGFWAAAVGTSNAAYGGPYSSPVVPPASPPTPRGQKPPDKLQSLAWEESRKSVIPPLAMGSFVSTAHADFADPGKPPSRTQLPPRDGSRPLLYKSDTRLFDTTMSDSFRGFTAKNRLSQPLVRGLAANPKINKRFNSSMTGSGVVISL
mmetsp:Transcript_46213/g.74048  ORF Transcript_46213/g.74048 Transcript_46213/m.74048 type:complete len:514 (-) Transcript_46213:599-2140(-)